MSSCPTGGKTALPSSSVSNERSTLAWVIYHFVLEIYVLLPFPLVNIFLSFCGPSIVLVFSLSFLFRIRAVSVVVLLCPSEAETMFCFTHLWELVLGVAGPWLFGSECTNRRPSEPWALRWIRLFSKWKNTLLLLFSLSLQTKIGKSFYEQTCSSDNKKYPDSTCVSQPVFD